MSFYNGTSLKTESRDIFHISEGVTPLNLPSIIVNINVDALFPSSISEDAAPLASRILFAFADSRTEGLYALSYGLCQATMAKSI